MSDSVIQHAQFILPKPAVHPQHPLRNAENHHRLLEYCKQRMDSDALSRENRVTRYSQIDRDVAAWMTLDDEDKKRQRKHEKDGTPQATKVSLPLTWVHIDDMMTYYAQTFAPNRGMFYHTAKPGETSDATQLVMLMNNHAVYGSFYRQLLRAIFNILKYNQGGLMTTWATDYGPQLAVGPDNQVQLNQVPIFRGNKMRAIDMYNLFYDPSVDLSELYKDGEWFGYVEMKSHYWLKQKCLDNVFFNCESMLNNSQQMSSTCQWYKSPPAESKMESDQSAGGTGRVNWFSWMGGVSGYLANNAFEIATIFIKINPNDFGLIPGNAEVKRSRNRYEIWRVTIANGDTIIGCEHQNNIHNHLPAYFGVLNDDWMEDATKSAAEILNPLQQFASFLLNAHVLSNRKNIYGTTFYDPTMFDYSKVPDGEVSARIPMKPTGYGRDIRTGIYHDNNVLDTKQTLQDLQGMIGIIDQFFPTQSLPSQIAGIDRAIDSQVAAVQQGSNRRQHKGARLIDDTMLRPMRNSLYYNIVQFQQDGEEVADFFSGEAATIDLQKLRDSSLVSLIGQGLKAIDRQMVAQSMRDLIFALIQSPALNQPQPDGSMIDIIKMLDYWTSMMDVDANLEQFRKQVPMPPAAAPGAPVSPAVQPATDPAAVAGGPIYGA